jgi:ligand-binding sensor protein
MSNNLVSKVRGNSWLFLRRAIKELVAHDDMNDDDLPKETAVIATTFIQMSFELSLVAYFLNDGGIYGIVRNSDTVLTEEELLSKFENNTLVTKSFNALKQQAVSRHVFMSEDDEYLVDEFQKIRNKLVHLNYEFGSGELYDLKYDLTYFLVQVIIPILCEEYDRPSEAISINLNSDDFIKLINFPPYAKQMEKVARENSSCVYKCIHCGIESLVTDDFDNEHCYSCCADLSGAGFINCPYCKAKKSLVYDALNIDCQSDRTIKGVCLSCDEDDMVYLCKKCDSEVPIEACIGEGKCFYGFCEFDE